MTNKYNPSLVTTGYLNAEECLVEGIKKTYKISLSDSDLSFSNPKVIDGEVLDSDNPDYKINTEVSISITSDEYTGKIFNKVKYHRLNLYNEIKGKVSPLVQNKKEEYSNFGDSNIFHINFFPTNTEEDYTRDFKEEVLPYLQVYYKNTIVASEIEYIKHRLHENGKPSGIINVKIKDNSLIYQDNSSFAFSIFREDRERDGILPFKEIADGDPIDLYRIVAVEFEDVDTLNGISITQLKSGYEPCRLKVAVYKGDAFIKHVYTLPLTPRMKNEDISTFLNGDYLKAKPNREGDIDFEYAKNTRLYTDTVKVVNGFIASKRD